MRLFLTILEGPSPGEAQPILASGDEKVLRRVVRVLQHRLVPVARRDDEEADQTDVHSSESQETR